MRPIVIRALLLACPIDPRQVRASRCSDTRHFGERRQKLLIALARISPHDAAQRRVRFERRRVDANRLALHQASRAQALEYPGKDGPMGLKSNQPTGPRNGRVIRRRLFQTDAQKLAQGKRVRRTPRDPALRVDAFEGANQQ